MARPRPYFTRALFALSAFVLMLGALAPADAREATQMASSKMYLPIASSRSSVGSTAVATQTRAPSPTSTFSGGTAFGVQPCSNEATLRSIAGETETTVRIVNQRTSGVRVFWLNYQGVREEWFSLGAGLTGLQNTFVTHVWVVTDQSGTCLGIFVADTTLGTLTIHGSGAATPTATPIPAAVTGLQSCALASSLVARPGMPPTQVRFYNTSARTVRVWWQDHQSLPYERFSLAPFQRETVDTFVSHPWVVTDESGSCRFIYAAEAASMQVTITGSDPVVEPLATLPPGTPFVSPTPTPTRTPGVVVPPPGRSTFDRPDDSSLPQVHTVYVVPSDGPDQQLDTTGALTTSVNAWNNWFTGQTGGPRIRLDTYGGQLDVSFLRLSRSDAQMASYGVGITFQILSDLRAAGYTNANKVYAVYYGGSFSHSCGLGGWPIAVQFLNGTPPGAIPCNTNQLAPSVNSPGYHEFGILHEVVHALGFVPSCAPHTTGSGHVSDDRRDLMWAGSGFWELPAILDVGRDDYFGHSIPGCIDLADSAFLDPTPANAVMPPGWGSFRATALTERILNGHHHSPPRR